MKFHTPQFRHMYPYKQLTIGLFERLQYKQLTIGLFERLQYKQLTIGVFERLQYKQLTIGFFEKLQCKQLHNICLQCLEISSGKSNFMIKNGYNIT